MVRRHTHTNTHTHTPTHHELKRPYTQANACINCSCQQQKTKTHPDKDTHTHTHTHTYTHTRTHTRTHTHTLCVTEQKGLAQKRETRLFVTVPLVCVCVIRVWASLTHPSLVASPHHTPPAHASQTSYEHSYKDPRLPPIGCGLCQSAG